MAVEVSSDAQHFTSLTSINANGRASVYTDTHLSPLPLQYYRLKLVDKDGSSSYRSVVKIQQSVAQQQVRIYPNPAQHTLQLLTNWPNASVQVYSIQGARVAQWNWQQGQQLSLGQLKAGVYMVEVVHQHQRVKQLLIKQ